MAEIRYTGKNAAEVRAYVDLDPGRDPRETWFLTKSQTASTGGQAWRYAKGGEHWPDEVKAAVYDPRGGWRPVRVGDLIRKAGSGYEVVRPEVEA